MSTNTLPALLAASVAAATALAAPERAVAISGGHPATGAEYGFVRYLEIAMPDGRSGSCTGSLIGPRLVLTAAHCVVAPDGRTALSIGVRKKRSASAVIRTKSVHIHAAYEIRNEDGIFHVRNDLATLILAEDAEPPYALTPYEYLWQTQEKRTANLSRNVYVDALRPDDVKAAMDRILSRDAAGRPYAAQVGFGLFGCNTFTGQCSPSGSAKPKFILTYLFNHRIDRAIVTRWCDPTPFSFTEKGKTLICSTSSVDGTLSPTPYGGTRYYGAQPGDSGGPAVVFDEKKRPFVIGVLSYGGMSSLHINMNLVEHLDFLRDVERTEGPTLRTVTLQ